MGSNVVLVVDDDPCLGELVEIVLVAALGVNVVVVADGERALVLACRLLPALVLLDVDLPGLSGLDVVRRLKSDRSTRDIPIIAITGRPYDEVVDAGFDGYVGKPFHPDYLVAKAREHLSERTITAAA